jgi:hypothetical protein
MLLWLSIFGYVSLSFVHKYGYFPSTFCSKFFLKNWQRKMERATIDINGTIDKP